MIDDRSLFSPRANGRAWGEGTGGSRGEGLEK